MTTDSSDFYVRFEKRFRGSRDDIKARQRVYLPLLDWIRQSASDAVLALDIGCGRGEWLENLREHGWPAYGRDINAAMVAGCQKIGLEVKEEDALAHLRGLPDACLDVVSGFHIVEHLPFDWVLELFSESLRVLKPGGIVIFETPNPENLQVGAHTFYLDPSHVRPIPPALLAFVADDAGFARAEIVRLHPFLEFGLGAAIDASAIEKHASKLSFGPQDYSLVALKRPLFSEPQSLEHFSQIIGSLNMQGLLIAQSMGEELRQAQERLAQKNHELEKTLHDLGSVNAQLEQERQHSKAAENQLGAVYASTSWRMTAPLRRIGALTKPASQTRSAVPAKARIRTLILAALRKASRLARRSPALLRLCRSAVRRVPLLRRLQGRVMLIMAPTPTHLLPSTTGRGGEQAGEQAMRQAILAQLGQASAVSFEARAIHQFVHTAAVGDGVTNGVFFIRRLLHAAGIESEIFSVIVPDELAGTIQSFKSLRTADGDALLLVHHSCGHDEEAELLALPMPKVLVYHNITPAEFFAENDILHHYCRLGREQLSRWPASFLGAIGDSELNTAELLASAYRNAETIPLLVDLDKILDHPWNTALGEKYADTFNLLFVGRIVENKCQHELIDVVRLLGERLAYPVKLLLVGVVQSQGYAQALREQIERHGLHDRVEFLGRVSEEDLYALYRCADAFVCLSEHEGFGMPLIEAMAFGVPVLARSSGNIPYTLGSGGILLTDRNPQAVADAIVLLANEPGLRRQLLHRQKESLARFEAAKLQQHLFDYLCRLGVQLPAPLSALATTTIADAAWRVEGPIQGSYSLAFVNRGVARGLAGEGLPVAALHLDAGVPLVVDRAFIDGEPEIAAMLARGTPGVAAVALRDCYPPRTDGMMAQIRVISAYGWEESAFPERYVRWFNMRLDLVTVLSNEVARALRDSGVRLPIAVVGAGADHLPTSTRLPEGVALGSGFRFLHISSCFPRKGVDVLLRAYGRAFRSSDDVTLVIKAFPNPHNTVEADVAAMNRDDPQFPRVIVISQDWSDADLSALYPACHAFVAPSRGEGFGLPMAEAMRHDLPVITLAGGGQADFCTPQTAWLCDYSYATAQNHLKVAHSAWREPDEDDLVRCLREVYSASPAKRRQKTDAAKALVLRQCTWHRVAQRTATAIGRLASLPILTPAPRIGWLTTWNSRCGIAAYSDYLLSTFPRERVSILANRTGDLVRADDDAVLRCWEFNEAELSGVVNAIKRMRIEVLVIQYNFGFFSCQALEKLILAAKALGVFIHLFLHSTKDVCKPDLKLSLRAHVAALQQVDRIFVHGVGDWNYLKEMGLDANVILYPHGVLSQQQKGVPATPIAAGQRIVASYGFLLPHKGLPELVSAFARLARDDKRLHLLLANALYPVPASMALSDELTRLIDELGIADRVTRAHDYLSNQDSLDLLGQAELIVFPYQDTQESSSAAVRSGLAAGSAVAVTPLPIFDDVCDAVLRLPGTGIDEIARGIRQFLDDPELLQQTVQNSRIYCAERAWPVVSNRLLNIIDGIALQRGFERHD